MRWRIASIGARSYFSWTKNGCGKTFIPNSTIAVVGNKRHQQGHELAVRVTSHSPIEIKLSTGRFRAPKPSSSAIDERKWDLICVASDPPRSRCWKAPRSRRCYQHYSIAHQTKSSSTTIVTNTDRKLLLPFKTCLRISTTVNLLHYSRSHLQKPSSALTATSTATNQHLPAATLAESSRASSTDPLKDKLDARTRFETLHIRLCKNCLLCFLACSISVGSNTETVDGILRYLDGSCCPVVRGYIRYVCMLVRPILYNIAAVRGHCVHATQGLLMFPIFTFLGWLSFLFILDSSHQ